MLTEVWLILFMTALVLMIISVIKSQGVAVPIIAAVLFSLLVPGSAGLDSVHTELYENVADNSYTWVTTTTTYQGAWYFGGLAFGFMLICFVLAAYEALLVLKRAGQGKESVSA